MEGPTPGQPRVRFWVILFILSWLPILTALVARARILLDAEWWYRLYEMAPSAEWLRIYWFLTIPMVALGLLSAAVLLFAGRPSAAMFTTACFFAAVTVSVGEVLLMAIIQFNLTATISSDTGVPQREIGGLQAFIGQSFTELVYRSLCLSYLVFSHKVRDSFGPITWSRFRSWLGHQAPPSAAA